MTQARPSTPDAIRAALPIVLRNRGRQLLRQIKSSASGVLTRRDPEDLHQLRVAVRKLRVLLPLTRDLFDEPGRRQLDSQLRVLASVLGPARDSDVFIAAIWPRLRAVLGEGRWVERLNVEWRAQRRLNRGKLRRALAAPQFGVLLSQLDGYFARPAIRETDSREAHRSRRFAKKALRRRARLVHERYRHASQAEDAQDQALHRLRIAIKKLRYELDFLAPLIRGWPPKKAGVRLADLQDLLGRMNDVATATALVETVLLGRHGAETTRLRKTLRVWRNTQRRSLKKDFVEAWKAWEKLNPFR